LRPEAVIFVGIQGSGKTTFYRERFFETHVRINLDMLRTRRREQLLFKACLQSGQSFVVDNTNPLATDRARLFEAARVAGLAWSHISSRRLCGMRCDETIREQARAKFRLPLSQAPSRSSSRQP